MSISLRANADGSGTLLNGATPVMEVSAAGVVNLPNIAAGSSDNQPVNFGQFNKSLDVNGWQKLPSGLIIQWGRVNSSTSGPQTVTYPIAFPNALLSAQISAVNGFPYSPVFDSVPGLSSATFSCWAIGSTPSRQNIDCWFLFVGC